MRIAVNNLDLIKTNLRFISTSSQSHLRAYNKLISKGLNKMSQILALVSLEPQTSVPIYLSKDTAPK